MDAVKEDMKGVDVRGGCRCLAVATTEGNEEEECSALVLRQVMTSTLYKMKKKTTCQVAKHLLNECRLQA